MKNSMKGMWKNSSLLEKILYLYVAFMPFTDICRLQMGVKRVGCTELVFLVLLIAWALQYIGGKIKLQKTLLGFPIVLMLVLFSVSFFNSKNILDSIVETSGLIYLIVLFYLILSIIYNYERLVNFLNVVFITGTAVALAGIFIFGIALVTGNSSSNPFLYYSKIESMARLFPRIKFVFESPNMLLAYLHFVLTAGLILFLLERKGLKRFVILLSIIVILLTSFFTGSRSFTGLLLSLFIVQLWFGRGVTASFLKYITIAWFIFFLTASIIKTIWIVFPVEIRKNTDGRFIELKVGYSYSTHFIRPAASINMFKKHPIIGVGFGTYNKNVRDNVDWDWFRRSFDFDTYPEYLSSIENKTLNFDPHSLYLGALAETGLAGFFGLVYFLIRYMALLVKRFRDSKGNNIRNIAYGCVLAGFIGFLLNGITLDILSMRYLWVMMAIGAAPYE